MATTGTVFIEVTADRAFDAAGNGNTHSTSSDKGVDYVSDTTPPAITSTLVGTLGSAVWYRSSVVLTWTVTDNESPVLATGCGPLTSTADTTGAAATCTATSLGGTSTATVSFKIDRTAPSVAVTGPTNGANYPLGAVPLAACSTTDSTSGVATPASISVTGGNVDGTGSFTVNCAGAIDIAGNSASAATVSYTVFDGSANPDVLDSFNRADGPLGPDWSGAAGVIFNRVSAGRLLVQVGGPALWGRQSFGSSQSAAVTLTSLPSFGIGQSLLLKVQGDGTSIAVTYDARLRNVRVTTLRVGGVTLTTYPASGATFASSDRFGAAALSNGTIRIYRNGALLSTLTLSHTDQAYFNARGGKIGLLTSGIGNLLDNFSVATEPT